MGKVLLGTKRQGSDPAEASVRVRTHRIRSMWRMRAGASARAPPCTWKEPVAHEEEGLRQVDRRLREVVWGGVGRGVCAAVWQKSLEGFRGMNLYELFASVVFISKTLTRGFIRPAKESKLVPALGPVRRSCFHAALG